MKKGGVGPKDEVKQDIREERAHENVEHSDGNAEKEVFASVTVKKEVGEIQEEEQEIID